MAEIIKEVVAMLKDSDKGSSSLSEPLVESVVTPTVDPVVDPVVESIVEPEVAPPVVDIDEDNRLLREKLNEMARQIQTGRIAPVESVQPIEPTSITPPEQSGSGIIPPIFVTKEEGDLLLDRPEEVLNKILARVFEAGREANLRELQPHIARMISGQVNVMKKVENFYTKNSDLSSYRDFVALVGNAVEQEHPDWNIDQVYEETAKLSRERLRLKTSADEPPQEFAGDPLQNPALPKTRGARGPRTTPVVTDENKQALNSMIEEQFR